MGPTDQRLRQLKAMSELLDSRWKGPWGIQIGLDGLIGLIPVVGDVLTTSLSFLLIFHAASLGCSQAVLFRMIMNVVVENVIDMIPLVGNLFDFAWKANQRNLRLLERHMTGRPPGFPWLVVFGLVITFLILLTLIFFAGSWVWRWYKEL